MTRPFLFVYFTMLVLEGWLASNGTVDLASIVPGPGLLRGGGRKKAWYPLHAHALHFPYNLL